VANKVLVLSVSGGQQLASNLAKLKSLTPFLVANALQEEAESMMDRIKDSKPGKGVPHDRGGLAASGLVNDAVVMGPIISVRVGFGGSAAPYALAVHENPRAGKTQGVSPSGRRYPHFAAVGSWKYLERELTRLQSILIKRVSARIKREWGALLGG
jgi:hypothetical protein